MFGLLAVSAIIITVIIVVTVVIITAVIAVVAALMLGLLAVSASLLGVRCRTRSDDDRKGEHCHKSDSFQDADIFVSHCKSPK